MAETPDTQMAVFDFDKLLVSFELTLIRPTCSRPTQDSRQRHEFPYWLQNATRIEIYGTKGLMIVGRHGGGWQVFTRPKLHDGVVNDQIRPLPRPGAQGELRRVHPHAPDAQRRHPEGPPQRADDPLGNISYRLGGQKLLIDPQTETDQGQPRGHEVFPPAEYRKPYVIEDEV